MVRLRDGREWKQVYRRSLPGGGFVTIEVAAVGSLLRPSKYCGKLIVERRGERERREGHTAPAVAEVVGSSISSVVHELFPLAQSNLEIATRCLARARTPVGAEARRN